MPYKGQRTNKHREAAYAFVVDIPNPRTGLGQRLNDIIDASSPLGGEQWAYSYLTNASGRILPQAVIRVGFKDSLDAGRIAWQFRHLGAVRAR